METILRAKKMSESIKDAFFKSLFENVEAYQKYIDHISGSIALQNAQIEKLLKELGITDKDKVELFKIETWEQFVKRKQKEGIEKEFDLKPGTLKNQNSDSHVFVTPGDKNLVEAEKVDHEQKDHVEI